MSDPGPPAPLRHFTGWDRPLLPQAARLLLERPGEVGGEGEGRGRVDLRDHLVALPGRRAGRRLTELLLEEAEGRGVMLLPPEITTVGALPERLYRPEAPPPEPILDRALWVSALQALPPQAMELLLPDPPDRSDDPGWARMARTVRGLHREVGAGGWDFQEVGSLCRKGLLFSDHTRWEALATVQQTYRRLLARYGRQDREAARRRALAGGPLETDREIWIVGAVEMAPVVRQIVLAARSPAPPTVVVPAPESLEDRFDELGTVLPDAFGPDDLPAVDDRIRVVMDPGEQADEALAILVGTGGRFGPEEVTLGAPDPQVAPHLVERLSAAGVPVRTPPGRKVEHTGLFQLLETLAGFLESREYEAFADLMRHPIVEGALMSAGVGGSGAGIPDLVDRYRGLHLPGVVEKGWLPDGGEPSWDRVEPHFRGLRDALDRLLGELDGERRLGEWSEPFRALLVKLLGERPLSRVRDEDRETLEMVGRIREALDGLHDLPPELAPRLPAHRALRVLLEEIREGEPVPPAAEEGAVEVLGWLELALDDAPVMVVTGMNEPHVPQAVTGDPFLPHALRRKLGLLDNQGRWARDLLHLNLILGSRKGPDDEVVLLAGRRDGDGNPLRLSRLLLGGAPEEVARRLVRFLGEEDGGGGEGERRPLEEEGDSPPGPGIGEQGGEAGQGGPPPTGEPGSAFQLPPERELRAPALPERISVTTFRRLLADPYLYALEAVLGLEGVDDQAREMDPLLFGNVAHAVLEAWGKSDARDSGEADEIQEALLDLLDKEVRSRFGRRPLPAVRLQAAQLRTRLGAFARWQAGHRARGWRVARVETRVDPGVPFDVDGAPILLRGRIDRVDHHPGEGRWLLLDYKTGDRARDPDEVHRAGPKASRRWVDLQLPLYRKLAPALTRDDGGPLIPPDQMEGLGMGYLVLPRDRERTGLLEAAWSDQELDEAEEAARQVVRILREGRFVFDPAASRVRPDDPLAPLLGQGVLGLYRDDDGAEDGADAGGEGRSGHGPGGSP